MKAKSALIAAVASVGIASTAHAQFTGAYAPANWTFSANGGSGSAINDGTTLIITGNNNSNNLPTYSDYFITAVASGTVSFDWTYTSPQSDTGTWDSGGYQVNFTDTTLAFNSAAPTGGSASFPVNAGDTFGFYVLSQDGFFGEGVLTITNFSAPVPAPGALALLGLAGLAGARRRRPQN